MISYIEISDFAIVKELKLDLFSGLNIITGETGAGKSVIIEAVSMALGARADSGLVRTGADKAVITLVIDRENADISEDLSEIGAPDEDPLIIRREISASGRSLCRVNGMPVPLSSLSKLCKRLADIHGQYDQQYLLDNANHVNILDLFGGKSLADISSMVSEIYENYASASLKLRDLKKRVSDNARQKEILSYEVAEIRSAGLSEGEDETLEDRIRLMENTENIADALSSAYQEMFGGDLCAYSKLGSAFSEIQRIEDFSSDLKDASERLGNLYYELEDLQQSVRSLRDSVNYSPEELNEANERLELINKFKRKFGGSISAVLEYAENAEKSLSEIENADAQFAELEADIKSYKEQYDLAAARLSKLRKDAAKLLEERINKELTDLNFKNAQFAVDIRSCSPGRNGIDEVEFMISANLGESLKPLSKVASGGELSRIMLATKRIIGDIDGIPTMIFDEIDTGISGATAGVVGEKLSSIAQNHQIICITHLPQIASQNGHHFIIEKVSDEISTHTTVVPLGESDRVEEIARLLSGTTITDSARQTAKEMLVNNR